MTLRTTALIAGALGLLLLIAGLIADGMRPEDSGTPRASLDTGVLVIGPDQVAIATDGTIQVEGDGELLALTGRTADVDAWAATRDVTVLTGVPTWEELSTDVVAAPPSTVSPSPSPSPTASPSASPSPSPEPAAPLDDIWRDSWTGTGTLELDTAAIPPGLTLVVLAQDDAALTGVELAIPRAVDDSWVSPLKWWGAVLAVFGLLALVWLIVDLRSARSRVESTVAERRRYRPAFPGGRRERREAAAETGGLPVVSAGGAGDDARVTPETPAPDEPHQDGDDAQGSESTGEERP